MSDPLFSPVGIAYQAFAECGQQAQAQEECYASKAEDLVDEAKDLPFEQRRQFASAIGADGLGLLAAKLPSDEHKLPLLRSMVLSAGPGVLWPAYQRLDALEHHRVATPGPQDEGMQTIVSLARQSNSIYAPALEFAHSLRTGEAPFVLPKGDFAVPLMRGYELAKAAGASLSFDWIAKNLPWNDSELAHVVTTMPTKDLASFTAQLPPEHRERSISLIAHLLGPEQNVAFWNRYVDANSQKAASTIRDLDRFHPETLAMIARAAEQWPDDVLDVFMHAYADATLTRYGSRYSANPIAFTQWIERLAAQQGAEPKELFHRLAERQSDNRALGALSVELSAPNRRHLDAAVKATRNPDGWNAYRTSADEYRLTTAMVDGRRMPATAAATDRGIATLAEVPNGAGLRVGVVKKGSVADQIGLHEGDTILSIGMKPAQSAQAVRDHFFNVIDPSSFVSLEYQCKLLKKGEVHVSLPPAHELTIGPY